MLIQLASNEELEILSVLSEDSHDASASRKVKTLRLVPSTHITFIGRRYRFVFCLDVSPSLATVVSIIVNFKHQC
jgi:hypothetical protein